MKFSATLTDFLISGSLGRLRLGLNPQEVELLCGAPDDVSTPGFPRIWKYGDLQIAFISDCPVSPTERTNFIGLYLRSHKLTVCPDIALLNWWPDSGTTLPAFTDYLDKHDIRWSVDPVLANEEQTTLRVGIGVSATFTHENALVLLDSLQFSGVRQLQ